MRSEIAAMLKDGIVDDMKICSKLGIQKELVWLVKNKIEKGGGSLLRKRGRPPLIVPEDHVDIRRMFRAPGVVHLNMMDQTKIWNKKLRPDKKAVKPTTFRKHRRKAKCTYRKL